MAYAFVIPWAGFTAATVVFLLLWLLVGGIRKPLQLFSVTLIGTVVLLYIFVKLALMPLDRGQGIFGEFTIALFRLLGIF
jgi:putative tricarboxylic transport membrane protein